jgi:sortase (surface protein transpeptidase)
MRWIPEHARPRAFSGSRKSGAIAVAAGVCVCVIAGGGMWVAVAQSDRDGQPSRSVLPLSAPISPAATATATTTATVPVAGSATSTTPATPTDGGTVHPVWLAIPAIGLRATLQVIGLDASGTLQPPASLTQAGWYGSSPVPGDDGPAIIAGHVDSYSGPAVFFQLKSLSPGTRITVGLSSGRTVAFRATAIQRYAKSDFPTEQVYGARPDPELRLITCGGNFAAGHYLDNVVVYAAEDAM